MKTHKKEEARRIVLNCVKDYQSSLLDNKFLIIYKNSSKNCFEFIELLFLKRNFQHLTGLELVDHDKHVLTNHSEFFYEKCINQKLSLDDFQFKKDGTTNLKLQALPTLIKIQRVTKIAGAYNYSRPYLLVDKVVGNVNFCLGLKYAADCYVPSSALLGDIKDLAMNPYQVIAILKKDKKSDLYENISYAVKSVNLHNCNFDLNIKEKINLKNYISKIQN
jgi:hypothetical protein